MAARKLDLWPVWAILLRLFDNSVGQRGFEPRRTRGVQHIAGVLRLPFPALAQFGGASR